MEAELAIILKRVGALKRRGTSGSKLDELLNEAKGKPKLKRLGSFDEAPRGMLLDDTFLCPSEANNLKVVEIDKEGPKDIWQAIEVQEGISVQRRNGLVGKVPLKIEPVRIGFVSSAEFVREKPNPSESNMGQRSPERLAVPDRDRALVHMSVLDSAEFIQEKPKPNTLEKSTSPRTSEWLTVVDGDRDLESVEFNSNLASESTVHTEDEPLNADEGGWEEFIQEKLNTLENNVSERTPEGLTVAVHDSTPESVAVNSQLTSEQTEPLNLDEDGWVESIQYKNGWEQDFRGYSITCAEPASPGEISVLSPAYDPGRRPLDALIQFEDDMKCKIFVGTDQLEEAHRQLSADFQGQTEASALEVDQTSAEPSNPGEIPGVSAALDSVVHIVGDTLELPEDDIKNEIIVRNSIFTSLSSDSDHVDMDRHADDLDRADTSEGQFDDVSDQGQSSRYPSDGLNLQTAQDDLNNLTRQLSPSRTN